MTEQVIFKQICAPWPSKVTTVLTLTSRTLPCLRPGFSPTSYCKSVLHDSVLRLPQSVALKTIKIDSLGMSSTLTIPTELLPCSLLDSPSVCHGASQSELVQSKILDPPQVICIIRLLHHNTSLPLCNS